MHIQKAVCACIRYQTSPLCALNNGGLCQIPEASAERGEQRRSRHGEGGAWWDSVIAKAWYVEICDFLNYLCCLHLEKIALRPDSRHLCKKPLTWWHSLRSPCVWCILSGMHFYLNFPHMTQIWWIRLFFFFWKVRKNWCCAFSGWFPFSEKAPTSYNPPISCLILFCSDSIAQFIVDSFWNLAHPSCTPNCYHEQSLSSRDGTVLKGPRRWHRYRWRNATEMREDSPLLQGYVGFWKLFLTWSDFQL